MKKISIIIATYNAEATLKRCLESIICQKTEEIELLIIDGYSKDQTLDIIKSYIKYVDMLISEPDKGIYDAWNKGINKASGQWIMFMGADDCLLSNALSKYLKFIETVDYKKIDYISATNEYVDNKGNVLMTLGEPYLWKKFKKYMCVAHVASLHNAQLFKTVGLYDLRYKICGDYELLMRKKLNSLFLNDIIAQMKMGGMSLSFNAVYETMKIRQKHSSVSNLLNILLTIKGVIWVIWRKYLTLN